MGLSDHRDLNEVINFHRRLANIVDSFAAFHYEHMTSHPNLYVEILICSTEESEYRIFLHMLLSICDNRYDNYCY